MPTAGTLERFIALVQSNAHAEACEQFTRRDGSVTRMEKRAWQRWEGERIAHETFFYDPAQRVPRRSS